MNVQNFRYKLKIKKSLFHLYFTFVKPARKYIDNLEKLSNFTFQNLEKIYNASQTYQKRLEIFLTVKLCGDLICIVNFKIVISFQNI